MSPQRSALGPAAHANEARASGPEVSGGERQGDALVTPAVVTDVQANMPRQPQRQIGYEQ